LNKQLALSAKSPEEPGFLRMFSWKRKKEINKRQEGGAEKPRKFLLNANE